MKNIEVWIYVESKGNFGREKKKKANLPSHYNPKND
jgi:hypothetical protein